MRKTSTFLSGHYSDDSGGFRRRCIERQTNKQGVGLNASKMVVNLLNVLQFLEGLFAFGVKIDAEVSLSLSRDEDSRLFPSYEKDQFSL